MKVIKLYFGQNLIIPIEFLGIYYIMENVDEALNFFLQKKDACGITISAKKQEERRRN